jgi:hypothetical protein
LNQIILKALEKDPERRFQTAAQFRDALAGLAPGRSTVAPEQAVGTPPPAAAPEQAVGMPPPAGIWEYRKLLFTGFFTFVVVMMALFALLKIAKP